MKKVTVSAFLAVFTFALVFSSCDDFFSTSLGTPRKYDSSKITVNSNDPYPWVDRAVGNPELANTVNEIIKGKLEDNKNSGGQNLSNEEKFKLSDAGIQLAVESSGIGESLVTTDLNAISDLVDNKGMTTAEKEEKVKNILTGIQDDLISSGGLAAADDISKIAGLNLDTVDYADNAEPAFDPYFAANAEPGDVAKSVMVLLMGTMGENRIEDMENPEDWKDIKKVAKGLKITGEGAARKIAVDNPTGDPATAPAETSVALAAYLNMIVTQDRFSENAIIGPIRDAFFENAQ